jgi:hypothetical protein
MSGREHGAASRRAGGAGALRWHRWVGLGVAAVAMVLAGTGMALQHAEHLGLRRRAIGAKWLLHWHGMEPAGTAVAYRAGEAWVGGLDGVAVVAAPGGEAPALTSFGPLVGAVQAGGLLAAATPEELALLTAEGRVVERPGRAARPPGPIEALGGSGGRLVVRTPVGIYSTDTSLAAWRPEAPDGAAQWSEPAPVPRELKEALVAAWRGQGITLHRLVLDVHTGRFFGPAGPWVADAAAAGLLFLAATGVWSAARSGRKGRGGGEP